MVRLLDRKLAGHQHLDAKRVTRRVLESNVVEDRTFTLLNVLERQAVFREQPRATSVGDAPLAMELVAGPVLPWPGMSETSGVLSSSYGTEVPQPMAVEPDPMVRRGLKRASEGDPEIAEICSWISDVNVNEEPHPRSSG